MKNRTISNVLRRGLTNFDLKVIALILMVFDHLYYFFSYTGKVPVFFSQIGRVSGYLFLFVVLEGFKHTSNRRRYMLRLYGVSVLMGCMNTIIRLAFMRPDGFYPMNNIFATFALLAVICQGIEHLKAKERLKGIGWISLAIIPNLLVFLFPMSMRPLLGIVMMTVLPVPMLVEGGIWFLLAGVILYALDGNKKLQMIVFGGYTLLWTLGMPYAMGIELTINNVFTMYYEWMGVFAIPIICLYNGERGLSKKNFFYAFYPIHVYLLYILSYVMYSRR